MLPNELVELADMIRTRKAEMQTVEVKAANKGCPEKLCPAPRETDIEKKSSLSRK